MTAVSGGDRPVPSYLLGFCGVALVNAIFIASSALPFGGIATRAAHHLSDAGHLLVIGCVIESAVRVYRRFGPKRPALGYVLLSAVSIGPGVLLLQGDMNVLVELFGIRATDLAVSVAAGVVSLTVPVVVYVGATMARPHRRALGVALGLTLATLNHVLLPGRQHGLHVLAVVLGAALISASLSGLAWHVRPRLRSIAWAARAVVVALVGWTVFGPQSQRARLEMSRTDGSLGVALLSILPVGDRFVGFIPATEWFRPRQDAKAIPPSQPPLVPRESIVLFVTMDAVRAELFTDPKYAGPLGRFHELAAESTYFREARSVGTGTVAVFASVFTGKHGFQLEWQRDSPGVRNERVRPLIRLDRSIQFPELLQDAGVRTVALTSFPPLHPGAGVLRGFDEGTIVEQAGQPFALARPMMSAVISQIGQERGGPLFLFVHLMDPHHPYNSAGKLPPFDGYVAETAACGKELGRLIDFLEKRGLWERTVLIVAADHGEGFNKHEGHPTHNTGLYEELVRVPLLIRVPGQPGRVVDQPVSLIDVGPTVLDLFGLPTPGAFMGQSLVPLLRGDDVALSRPVVATLSESSTLLELPMKTIVNFKTGLIELYDLESDPDERDNLADSSDGELVARLAALRKVHSLR